MTEEQTAELKTVVEAWLKEKNIPCAGIEVVIRLIPLRVVVGVPPKSRISKLVELSEEDWKIMLGLPLRKDLLELLTVLKERANAGVFQADIRSSDLFNAAECINTVFRREKVAYRFTHHDGEGNYTNGPYKIRVMS